MNLNFYPNDYNNQSSFNGNPYNHYNPYNTVMGLDNNINLRNLQQSAENNLQQIQQLQNKFNQHNNPDNTTNLQQPYYLFCGNKNDWDEFLMLNYGITEQIIFDEYKLFLQAKQELLEEQGKNKIDSMKDKIRNNNNNKGFANIDSTIQSNVKPEQVNKQYNINGNNNRATMGGSGKSSNGLLEQDKSKPKETNK